MNILVLCTGNSARSILGEALINQLGRGRFRAYSAGSHPAGAVNPGALRVLKEQGVAAGAVRSKSWDEFAQPGAPAMDAVITVCDSAAGEACPLWPGAPVKAHWGLPDPAAVTGPDEERARAFRDVYRRLEARVRRLVALPDEELRGERLRAALARIHAECA